VTTAGLQALSRSYANTAGRVIRTDAYFSFGGTFSYFTALNPGALLTTEHPSLPRVCPAHP
jgi:hypothetical protein